ncbi:MAG: hypothetical protein GC204_00935 [Chloroflexi bacterium]|nr:hypothetical protein [Chloroflexota bacterium]
MPYDFNWQDDEKTIIRMDIHGEVTWPLWYAAVDKVAEELGKTSHRVDLIFNDSVGMPKGNALPHLKATNAKLVSHPNMGLIVSVGTQNLTAFTKIMIGILSRVYGIDNSHNGGFVDSMDKALAIIAADRANSAAAV